MKAKQVCANFLIFFVGTFPLLNPYRKSLIRAFLRRDGVLAYPTEGVWGLGCLPCSFAAVMHLLELKQRSWQKGLLVVGGHINQLSKFLVGIEGSYRRELELNWPGPITYLVPDNGVAPRWIVGNHDTVGLRVTDHALVQELCSIAGPLVSTSANISSRPAAMNPLQVRRYFRNEIDYLVPGELGSHGRPSQIKVLMTGETLR